MSLVEAFAVSLTLCATVWVLFAWWDVADDRRWQRASAERRWRATLAQQRR